MQEPRYIPKLETTEPLSRPIDSTPVIDNSADFDLPFDIKSFPRLSLYNLKEISEAEGMLGRRSITERRAFSYPPTVFRSRKGVVYSDIIVKGGGAEISPNTALYDQGAYDDNRVVSTPSEFEGNKSRFHFKPIKGLTSYLGVHEIKSGILDYKMSEYLSDKGLRTRELIAAWVLPDNMKLSTPDGIITAAEFKEKTNVEPGLEAWAMRTKYRLHDISRLIYEIAHIPEPEDIQQTFNISRIAPNGTKYVGVKEHPCHVFVDGEYNQQQLSLIRGNLTELANSITVRAKFDQDKRFAELGNNHGNVKSFEQAQDFYKDYLPVFSEILGEQFATMDVSNAISAMSNPQNISLLAELVDHDVTLVNGKKLDENGNFIDISPEKKALYNLNPNFDKNFIVQMRSGYYDLQKLITDLNRTGMVNYSNNEIKDILKIYLESFTKELSKDSKRYEMRLKDINEDIAKQYDDFPENETEAESLDIFGTNWHKTYLQLLRSANA